MTHRIDPIADADNPLAKLELELVDAARRRHAAQTSSRARGRVVAWAIVSGILGAIAIALVFTGAIVFAMTLAGRA